MRRARAGGVRGARTCRLRGAGSGARREKLRVRPSPWPFLMSGCLGPPGVYRARASLVPIPFALVLPEALDRASRSYFSDSQVFRFGESSTPHGITLPFGKIIREYNFGGRRIAVRRAQRAEAHGYASRRRRARCQVVLRRDGVRLSVAKAAPHSLHQQRRARAACADRVAVQQMAATGGALPRDHSGGVSPAGAALMRAALDAYVRRRRRGRRRIISGEPVHPDH